jgi:non-ribosomal peptide synthetase component F
MMSNEVHVFPVSFAQQRLWFLDLLAPGHAFYNLSTALRLTFAVDAALMRRALNAVVARHESLRTTIRSFDGEPRQVVAAALEIELPLQVIRTQPGGEYDALMQSLMAEEITRPFDLAQGPLLRARLLRFAAQDHLLMITMHHIVSDGWSVGLLLEELDVGYRALLRGAPARLPALPIQYPDYAVWQRDWLRGPVLQHHLSYWRERLAGAAPLEIPTDRPRPKVQSYRGAFERHTIPAALTARLKQLGQREGTTLFMTLLAAFDVLLHRHSAQDDITVGVPTAGRNRAELEGLIGFFVNTVVMRVDLAGNPSFRELQQRVRSVCLGAFAHQELPFESWWKSCSRSAT